MNLLLVALGAAVGAPLRYLVDRHLVRPLVRPLVGRTLRGTRTSTPFPWGTLTVNVLGSFALGVLTGTSDRTATLVLGVGFCGAFTTYSTFGAETSQLAATGHRGAAGLNVALNLGAGLAAAVLGVVLAQAL